jgi:hypothetical protein
MAQPQTEEKPPLTVVRLVVQNSLRIKVLEMNPPPAGIVRIAGPNGAGKSSVINSVLWALMGKPTDATRPITKGETEGKVSLQLGEDLVVTVHTKKNKDNKEVRELEVKPGPAKEDQRPYQRPQEVLDKLLSNAGCRPRDFILMKPDKQLEMIRRVLKLDTSEIDARRKAAYDERTVVNSTLKRLTVRNEGLARFPDAPAKEIDVNDLLEEIQDAQEFNSGKKVLFDEIQRLTDKENAQVEAIKSKREEIQRYRDEIDRLTKLVAEESKKVEAWQEASNKTYVDRLAKEKEAGIFEEIDVTEMQTKLANSQTINEQVRQNQRLAEAIKEWNESEDRRLELEKILAGCDTERKEMIKASVKAANIAVNGLVLHDDHFEIDGIPFFQVNDAKKLDFAVRLYLLENPRIRVLHEPKWDDLDKAAKAAYAEVAAAHGAQVWAESVAEREDVEDDLKKGLPAPTLYLENGEPVELA